MKTSTKKIKIKIKPKAYPRWNLCKWPKKNKSKKILMMPTNSSTNSKTKIPNRLQSTVRMIKIYKILKRKREVLANKMTINKFQEKFMVPKIFKINLRITQALIKIKSNLSRKTYNSHFLWAIILRNWQRAWTSKTLKTSTSPKELTSNLMRNSLNWTEIYLTTLKLKMKLS